MKSQIQQLVNYINGFSELTGDEKIELLRKVTHYFVEVRKLKKQEKSMIK